MKTLKKMAALTLLLFMAMLFIMYCSPAEGIDHEQKVVMASFVASDTTQPLSFTETASSKSSTATPITITVDGQSVEAFRSKSGSTYVVRPDLKSGKQYLGYNTGVLTNAGNEVWASTKSWKTNEKTKFYILVFKDGKVSKKTVKRN